MIARTVISLAFIALAGGAFAANGECGVDTRSVTSTVPGADCAVAHFYAPQGEEKLGPAENLWQGYVLQVLSLSEGCQRGETQVVVDCADGSAYAFAPAGAALMAEEDFAAATTEGAYEQLTRFVRKAPRGYAEVAGWRRAGALTLVDLGSVLGQRVALGIHGQTYDLGCGCKLYNPGSPGAR